MHFQIHIFSDKQQECDLPIYGGGGGSSTTGASSGLNNTAGGGSEVTPASVTTSGSSIVKASKSKSNSEEVLKTEDQTLPLPSKCFRKLLSLITFDWWETASDNNVIIIDVLQLNVMLTGSNKHVSIHSPSSDIGPMSVISGVKSTPPRIHSESASVEENKSASKPLSRFGVDTEHEAELEKVRGEWREWDLEKNCAK